MCETFRRIIRDYKCRESASSTTSGNQTSISDATKINPSSLATEPTGLGVEGLYSVIKDDLGVSYMGFGLVKGFERKGTGLSIGGSNSFYDNDLLRRQYSTPDLQDFEPFEPIKGKPVDLNLAFAYTLWRPSRHLKLNVGGSAKYLSMTDSWGPGVSVLLANPWVGIGTGVTRLKIASHLPRINFVSSLIRLKVIYLDLEYNRLDSSDSFNLGPVHIFTLSLKLNKLILTGAQRHSRYNYYDYIRQYHYGVQYLLSNHFSLSYLNNLIPGCQTLGAQLYF